MSSSPSANPVSSVVRPAMPLGPGLLILLGATLGLLVGFTEAVGVIALSFIPGALSWRSGNSIQILYAAPLVNAIGFGLLGLVAAVGALIVPRSWWPRVLGVVVGTLAGYLGAVMPGPLLGNVAPWIFGLGVGAVFFRGIRSQESRLGSLVPKVFVRGMVAIAISWLAVTAGLAWTESRANRGAAAAAGSPNVILIVMDTQRRDHLSLYGYSRPTSPSLAALGQQALVFDQGVANSSWTLPSHSSMMTGRLPHEHRAGILRRPYLDGRFPTLAEEMAKHGYATAGIVANTYWASRSVGIARGFQRFEDYYGSIGDAFVRTSLGREVARTLLPWLGWRDVPGRKSAGVINQQMLSWLDTIGPRPFFAFLNYFDVHAPLLPPAGFAGRFSPSGRRTGGPATIDIGAIAGEIRVPGPDTLAALVDAYDESIAYLDSELGALFDQLKKRGQWDNTLVIVTADHGESYGDHGLLYHGHSLYSDQVNVPLVVSWPAGGIGTARRVDPVGLNQIPATVAQVAGLPTLFPGRSLLAVPDTSGAPIVLGVGRRSVVPFGWPSSRGWIAGLVTARWRYLEQEDGTARLYDPIADPGDLTDLGQSAQWADTVRDFHAKLAAINPASGLAPGNH